jgi:CTP:molybdopterin cytidylyltransferase MocA
MKWVGVLLAGGAGRRMGRPKALVRRSKESFLAHGVRHLWTTCDMVVVVLGAKAKPIRAAAEEEFEKLVREGRLHEDLVAARRHGATGLEVRFVENKRWAQGMFVSAQLGLTQALRHKPDAVLILPVDHPTVRPATLRMLSAAVDAAMDAYQGKRADRAKFAYAVVPRYQRRRGHPLAISAGLARLILADRGATDLSDAVRRNARLVGYLDCADRGVVRNQNRPGD